MGADAQGARETTGDTNNQWPVVIWKSIDIPGVGERNEMGSDLPYTVMHDLGTTTRLNPKPTC